MKKLALVLGALSLVSAVAYGAEESSSLKVTNIGQFIEIDNTSGNENIGEDVHFGNILGLSYEDWTFEIGARKMWSMDTHKEDGPKNSKGNPEWYGHIHSNKARVEFTAMKHFDGFNLGAKWRQEPSLDKFYLKSSYSFDMFSGSADLIYHATNGKKYKTDICELEMVPVKVKFHNIGLAYYVDISRPTSPEETGKGSLKEEIKQQFRISAPIYSNDKFGISAEYRYQFDHEQKFKEENISWHEENKHIAILSGNYKINDALSLYGSYEYDIKKYKEHNDAGKKDDNYYGEFVIGWNYSF